MSDPAHGEQSARCRQSVCCVCLAYGERQRSRTESHHELPIGHVSNRGRDRAELDADCIPLCGDHHRERHDKGFGAFWERHNRVDWVEVRDAMRRPMMIWDALQLQGP